jgi:hypothetical protein
MFTLNRGPRSAQVFYDIDYIRERWGRLFRVRSVTPEAYFLLTAVLLENKIVVRRVFPELWG